MACVEITLGFRNAASPVERRFFACAEATLGRLGYYITGTCIFLNMTTSILLLTKLVLWRKVPVHSDFPSHGENKETHESKQWLNREMKPELSSLSNFECKETKQTFVFQ